MKIKRRIALVIGVVMAFAFFIFARGVILIAEDFKRPDISRGENTVGLIIVLTLGPCLVLGLSVPKLLCQESIGPVAQVARAHP